jgi:hypothetical protein
MTPEQSSDAIQPEGIVSRPATEEEIELAQWGAEAYRKSIETVHEANRQLVVLTTAVLGGFAALMDKIPMPMLAKAAGMVLLLAALGASILGTMPMNASLNPSCVTDLKPERERGLAAKSTILKIASGLLFASFAFIVFGLLYAAFLGAPAAPTANPARPPATQP